MINNIKNLMFLVPVMGYYILESVIISIPVFFTYRFFILPITNVNITYLQWVAIIWIIKVIFFDVFKLISGLSTMPNNGILVNNESNNN